MVMNIRVLTPDRVICSTTADEVILPGLTGQVGVLDGHATLITALDTGLLRIKLADKWTPIILCGGLAEIDRNRVTVLVNDVEELVSVELNEATKELDVGGDSVTEEIQRALSLTYDEAEDIKKAVDENGNLAEEVVAVFESHYQYLIEEIQKVIGYYIQNSDDAVSKIYLVGGGAYSAGLINIIADTFEIETEIFKISDHFALSKNFSLLFALIFMEVLRLIFSLNNKPDLINSMMIEFGLNKLEIL